MSHAACDPMEIISLIERRIQGNTVRALVSMLSRLDAYDALAALEDALGIGEDSDAPGGRVRKVLVMGASAISEDKMRSLTRGAGYDSDWFEYRLDYAKLHGRAVGYLRNSSYSAVIVGPMPHSTDGNGGASSAIERMKRHPELYPPVIEARDSNGLKLTNNSFKEALEELRLLMAS